MRASVPVAVVGLLAASLGCRGGPATPVREAVNPTPRRTVVWLGDEGLDEGAATALADAGVDELLVRRGVIRLGGGVPALRLESPPAIAPRLPVGVVMRLEGLEGEVGGGVAATLWRALLSELGQPSPVELVLDVPRLSPGLASLVAGLRTVSGIPVVPLLLPEQLREPAAAPVAAAATEVVVPFRGALGLLREGAEASTLSLVEQLAPLAGLGVRVRVAVVLRPQCEPVLGEWGDGLDALCEADNAEISTSSELDRTFVFRRELEWSGRRWAAGDRVAVRWVDVARLGAAIRESSLLMLPELAGWDLVFLPPGGPSLGISRESLLAYLRGAGPKPRLVVREERSGRSLQVELVNESPFASAVSSYGNWLEVSVAAGKVVAEDRGAFDRIVLGSSRGGEWEQSLAGGANGVRFMERFVAPGEALTTGPIRLPSSRSTVRIRWQVVLSTGEVVGG